MVVKDGVHQVIYELIDSPAMLASAHLIEFFFCVPVERFVHTCCFVTSEWIEAGDTLAPFVCRASADVTVHE